MLNRALGGAVGFLTACVVLLAGGCQSARSPATSGSGSGSGPEQQSVRGSRSKALADTVLAPAGFNTLWTKEPSDQEGIIRSAYLLPEGIFTVNRMRGGAVPFRLVRYDLETGLMKWMYDLDEPLEHAPVSYRYPPAAEGSRPDELYILQKDMVRCLDLQWGAEMWRVQLPFPVSCGPVVDEKQYYLGSLNRRIYAMPKKGRVEAWSYITGGEIKAPGTLGASGQIYFTSTDKLVYRFEPQSPGWTSGKSWRFTTGGRILGSPVHFSRWVFVGSTDFKLYSFEVDGRRAWDFPAEGPVAETPVVISFRPDKPLVFGISQDERRSTGKRVLWTVDAKTGKEVWHRDHVAQVVAVGKRAVYLLPDIRPGAAGGERRLLAVDALTGEDLASVQAEGFDFIPTNDADHGANSRGRGTIYLISRSGLMQAIREVPQ